MPVRLPSSECEGRSTRIERRSFSLECGSPFLERARLESPTRPDSQDLCADCQDLRSDCLNTSPDFLDTAPVSSKHSLRLSRDALSLLRLTLRSLRLALELH